MIDNIKKSVLSGIMIAFGCSVYLSCVDKGLDWIGLVHFCFLQDFSQYANMDLIFTQGRWAILPFVLEI